MKTLKITTAGDIRKDYQNDFNGVAYFNANDNQSYILIKSDDIDNYVQMILNHFAVNYPNYKVLGHTIYAQSDVEEKGIRLNDGKDN